MGTARFLALGVPGNDAENTTDLYGTPYHVMTTRKTARGGAWDLGTSYTESRRKGLLQKVKM